MVVVLGIAMAMARMLLELSVAKLLELQREQT
jgi:hypothetical protein